MDHCYLSLMCASAESLIASAISLLVCLFFGTRLRHGVRQAAGVPGAGRRDADGVGSEWEARRRGKR